MAGPFGGGGDISVFITVSREHRNLITFDSQLSFNLLIAGVQFHFSIRRCLIINHTERRTYLSPQ